MRGLKESKLFKFTLAKDKEDRLMQSMLSPGAGGQFTEKAHGFVRGCSHIIGMQWFWGPSR